MNRFDKNSKNQEMNTTDKMSLELYGKLIHEFLEENPNGKIEIYINNIQN